MAGLRSATVLTYLAANSDVAAAARRLNVHPNTCRYRLARAEEISGAVLRNPDERLLLWLQLRLSDQLGALRRVPLEWLPSGSWGA